MDFIARKDAVIESKDQEIAALKASLADMATKDETIESKDKEIAMLKAANTVIAMKDETIASKDQEISSLKAALSSPLTQLEHSFERKDEKIVLPEDNLMEPIATVGLAMEGKSPPN